MADKTPNQVSFYSKTKEICSGKHKDTNIEGCSAVLRVQFSAEWLKKKYVNLF